MRNSLPASGEGSSSARPCAPSPRSSWWWRWYFRIPMDRAITATTVIGLVIGVLALFAIIAWQIREIMRSEHPVVRAVEALAFAIPVYVLLFATIYFLMAHAQSAAFGVPLSRTDAMYFSATVFTTVGFGNIAAQSETARIIVDIADDAGSGDHRHRRARSAQRRQGRQAAPRHARGARTRSGAGRDRAGRRSELTGSVTPKMPVKTKTRRRPVQESMSEVLGRLRS